MSEVKEGLSAAEKLAMLTSREKAAILIRGFSKDTVKHIVGDLGKEERESLTREIAIMKSHETNVVAGVLIEYLEYFKGRDLHTMSNGIEVVKELFVDVREVEKQIEKLGGEYPKETAEYLRQLLK